jgi:hypothetical protein
MTHHAVPVWHKGSSHKGLMVEKRCWKGLEYNSGVRDRGMKQHLCLGSKEAFYEALGQTIGLEIVKLAARYSARIKKISVKASCRIRSQPK